MDNDTVVSQVWKNSRAKVDLCCISYARIFECVKFEFFGANQCFFFRTTCWKPSNKTISG